jgi:hypothetical protein
MYSLHAVYTSFLKYSNHLHKKTHHKLKFVNVRYPVEHVLVVRIICAIVCYLLRMIVYYSNPVYTASHYAMRTRYNRLRVLSERRVYYVKHFTNTG